MAEPVLPEFLRAELKELVREVFREEINVQNVTPTDKLLTVREAALLMNVKPRWLYRHAAKLPFTRVSVEKLCVSSPTISKIWRESGLVFVQRDQSAQTQKESPGVVSIMAASGSDRERANKRI